ncbi:MAG: helix-turn-helix domain-containing protein [Eubacteriales bacterium]|nr:helix-turn-helix domain-containing protein [Eubacteriales bacterium]
MEWAQRMNAVMDYTEEHLSGDFDPNTAARLAACSYPLFQGMFAQITGLSFTEYMRRRRLSCAAYDLQNTDLRVLDVAVKYGYASADAFSRAFCRLHGLAPSRVRAANCPLTFTCRLHFVLAMEGVESMTYTAQSRAAFSTVGIRRTTPVGGGTWAIVKGDGSNQAIYDLCGRYYDLGLCFGFADDGSNDYMCAVEWTGETLCGLDRFDYPATLWLVFEASGPANGKTLGSVWRRIHQEFLPQSRYRLCGLPTIERYVLWDEAADQCRVEIGLPVVAKGVPETPS